MQLTPVSAPPGLDAALAGRGWELEAGVSIQIASLDGLAEPEAPGVATAVEEEPDADWFHVAGERSRFGEAQDAYRGFLARIGPAAGFALARLGGEPAAAGLGVVRGDWAGVFSMFTLPERRRRGGGRAVLGTLAGWARRRGASRLYLQVERDNPGALALYAGAGFREAYGYHYRRAPQAP